MTDVARDVLLRGQRVDAGKLGCERLETARFDACLVHEAPVEVAGLLRVGAGAAPAAGSLLENLVQIALGSLLEQRERAVVRSIRRNRGRRQPLPVDVTIEVVLGPHRLVEVLRIHAGLDDPCLRDRRRGGSGRRRGRLRRA